MIRHLSIFTVFFLFVACSTNPVGNVCVIEGFNVDPTETEIEENSNSEAIVSSPALDCTSRVCLFQPNEAGAAGGVNVPLCSDFCESASDCDRETSSPCETGFSCEVASTTGPLCCQRMCICNDFLFVPESGEREEPSACDPDNQANLCCNLPGRDICPGNANNSTPDDEPAEEPEEDA